MFFELATGPTADLVTSNSDPLMHVELPLKRLGRKLRCVFAAKGQDQD